MSNFIRKYFYRFKEFWLYSVGGAIGFVIDFSLLYVLTEFAGFWYLVSNVISVSVAIITNYSWQRLVTFKSLDNRIARQFIKFVIVSVLAIGFNVALMYLLVDIAGLWYMLAKIFVTVVLWFWNFFGNKYFTFRVKESKRI
jgi:dolichol-phosphate mannosyltransferase